MPLQISSMVLGHVSLRGIEGTPNPLDYLFGVLLLLFSIPLLFLTCNSDRCLIFSGGSTVFSSPTSGEPHRLLVDIFLSSSVAGLVASVSTRDFQCFLSVGTMRGIPKPSGLWLLQRCGREALRWDFLSKQDQQGSIQRKAPPSSTFALQTVHPFYQNFLGFHPFERYLGADGMQHLGHAFSSGPLPTRGPLCLYNQDEHERHPQPIRSDAFTSTGDGASRLQQRREVETPSSPIRCQAPDVKYPEKVECHPDGILDVGYPEKMERRKGDRPRVHGPAHTPCIPYLVMAKDFKASVLHVSELSIDLSWISKNSPQSWIALSLVRKDTCSTKDGAPTGPDPTDDDLDKNDATAPLRAPNWEEMAEMLKWVP
ncbi:hypothetical protein CK203_097985 [Vitis vinifera]|uniref:Uncharacterized protein n=1 Tax=Vitis vinifera TaxID=29760 RepID=A0A438CXY3_VITVI|nr:hypothetical protein CK203_097985 [Vitis vinifera]